MIFGKIPRPGQQPWDVLVGILLGLLVLTLVMPAVLNLLHEGSFSFDPSSLFVRRQSLGPSCRCQILNNLKQMAFAIHSFNDVHKRLPPAFDEFGQLKYPASLHVHLLPYLEQGPLYKHLAQGPGNFKGNEVISPFLDPCDSSVVEAKGIQNFAANLRVFSDKGLNTPYHQSLPDLSGIEPGAAIIPKTFSDGTSNTIVFSTRHAVCGPGGSRYEAGPDSPFGAFIGENHAEIPASTSNPPGATFLLTPTAGNCRPLPFMAHCSSMNGLSVALGDASVRTLSPSISPETWNRAMQPNDGLPLGEDWDE